MRTEPKRTATSVANFPPKISIAMMTAAVTMFLNTGFMMMLITAFQLGLKALPLIILPLVLSLIFAFIFCQDKKFSVISLGVPPALFAMAMLFNWFGVRKGFIDLLYYVKRYAFFWFPGDYLPPADNNANILIFLMAYTLITVPVTVFVLTKRKFIPSALLCYLPLFICSVANVIMVPDTASCIIAGTGVILLLLSHAFRHKKQAVSERILLILTIPVMTFTILFGVIFPQSRYNKDELARKILSGMQEKTDEAAGSNNPVSNLLNRALNGFKTPNTVITYDTFSPLFATNTDLSKVGPFDPPSDRILKVYRSANPDYTGIPSLNRVKTMYLKVESMDTYKNNTLSSSKIKMNVYDKDFDPEYENSPYNITITPLQPLAVDIVPYYTDFYVAENVGCKTVNPYNTTNGNDLNFASSPLPVMTGNIYSTDYLNNYVYNIALEVPDATEDTLTKSGDLPDWYMDVYNGYTEMSDVEKVRAVTEFVRGLHPYNKDTALPPEDADFVPWFISDAESGICVHYAITTVILLRMLKVPARYVRGYVDLRSYTDSESIIFASQAHAWFEVFIPEYGWVMGDSTPGYAKDAEDFNIDAVAREHPEIETAVFSNGNVPYGPGYKPDPTPTVAATVESSEETSSPTPAPTTAPGETTAGATHNTDRINPSESGLIINDSVNDPSVSVTSDSELSGSLKIVIRTFAVILVIIVAVLLITGIIRLVIVVYWRRKFSAKSNNGKAIACYHYYKFMGSVFRFVLPSKATAIAEKAAFAEGEISSKELQDLIAICNKHMTACSSGFSSIKNCIYKVFKLTL